MEGDLSHYVRQRFSVWEDGYQNHIDGPISGQKTVDTQGIPTDVNWLITQNKQFPEY